MRSVFVLLFTSTLLHAQTVTFEDLTLPPNSNVNSTPFSSGGVAFTSAPFEGFSYSNIKDITTAGFTNQYAAYVNPLPLDPLGAGAGGSANYAIAYDPGAFGTTPTMTFPAGTRPLSLMITNTTYAALSMRDGDGFAKKFGGLSGNDPDFLRLTIRGFDANSAATGTVEFLLADYTFANNTLDYIVKDWTPVNLAALTDDTRSLRFTLDSTDNGPFGINTPAYFAVENVLYTPIPEPVLMGLLTLLALFMKRIFNHR